MSLGLLQHLLDRFGVVTVMDVTLFDLVTHAPLITLDTLKISSITGEAQSKEVKGGRRADPLLEYSYGRTVNVEFQDALVSLDSMSTLWGATLVKGAVSYHDTFEAAYGTGITPPAATPVVIGDIISAINVTTGVQFIASQFTVTAGKLAIALSASPAIAAPGATDIVRVYFTNKTPASPVAGTDYTGAGTLTITSNSFPPTVQMIGQTVYMEQRTGKEILAEIEIPKLKLGSNFTFSLEAEGDASVFDFTGKAMANAAKEMVVFKTIKYM